MLAPLYTLLSKLLNQPEHRKVSVECHTGHKKYPITRFFATTQIPNRDYPNRARIPVTICIGVGSLLARTCVAGWPMLDSEERVGLMTQCQQNDGDDGGCGATQDNVASGSGPMSLSDWRRKKSVGDCNTSENNNELAEKMKASRGHSTAARCRLHSLTGSTSDLFRLSRLADNGHHSSQGAE